MSGADLLGDDTQKELTETVKRALTGPQGTLYPELDEDALVGVIRDVSTAFVNSVIAIPRIQVYPKGAVQAGFHRFDLDLRRMNLQPVAKEILVQELTGGGRSTLAALHGGIEEVRLADHVIRRLVDYDDVDYDRQADVLYDLADQVVRHLQGYLADDDEVRNVLLFHERQIGDLVHGQMQEHAWQKESESYEAKVFSGLIDPKPQNFTRIEGDPIHQFDIPPRDRSKIRSMVFGGFERCLYPEQKFDSDSERAFAVLLEQEGSVLKWFKPGPKTFRIGYGARLNKVLLRDYR